MVLGACGGKKATSIPTATPTPVVKATPTATPAVTSQAFFLRVTSPKNESVVSTPVVQVTGETTPDAVVSVAGQPVEVDADGRFAVELTLVEGPSFIEVIASDFSGHQLQEVIAVIFAP